MTRPVQDRYRPDSREIIQPPEPSKREMEIEKLSNDNQGLQFNSYQPRPHAMQDSFQGDNNDYYN